MSLSPIAIIFIASGGVISFIFAFCYRRRLKKTERKSNVRIHRSALRAPDQYLFSSHPSEAQQQQRTGKAATYIHPTLSSHSLHVDTKRSDEEEDNDECSFRNSNPPLLGVITSQSYTRTRSPSPVGIRPVARDIELASLPPVHHSSSSSSRRKELSRLQSHPASSATPRLETLPAVEDGIDRRVDGYFQKSSLPRPLGLQRPVVSDTSITSSSRVVANIVRAAPTGESSQEKAEIEPIVVYVQKRSSLRNAPTTQSSTARGEQLQSSRTRAASISRMHQHGRASPLHRTGSTDTGMAMEGSDPLKAKEEVHRQAPHAVLLDETPTSSSHACLASQTPVVDMSSGVDTDESDEEENRRSMNTAFLMLQPYMSVSDQSLPLPSVSATRRAPSESTLSSLPDPPLSPMSSSSAPTRPARRVPSITRKQRRQMQASLPAEEPPKPLSSILELPTPPTTTHVAVPPTPPSRSDSTPDPQRAASPFSFSPGRSFAQTVLDRGSFSTHSGSGSASGSVSGSGSGSERAISPVPSNASSGHSSNLSTVLLNASMASSFTTSSAGTSIVSTTMESPALSPTMSLASPTGASMYSPVTPHSGRSLSSRNYHNNQSMDDLMSREEPTKVHHHHRDEKQGGEEQVKSSSREILQPAWLHHPPLPGSAQARKRVNDPHLGTAGARLSEFSYVP